METPILIANSVFASRLALFHSEEVVLSQPDFESLLLSKKKIPPVLVIQMEVRWDDRPFSFFYGLELIKKLRLEGQVRSPIVLIGPFSELNHEGIRNGYSAEAFRILRDPAVHYLPARELIAMEPERWKEYWSGLRKHEDPDLFTDVCETLYDKRGYVGEFFHELYYELRQGREATVLWKELSERLLHFVDSFPEVRQELRAHFFSSWSFEEGAVSLSSLRACLQECEKKAKELIAASFPRLPQNGQAALPEILYIDDEPELRRLLSEKFEANGITCHTAGNIEEGCELLEKSENIRVIVCDLRFYDDEKKYSWEQGYHIVRHLPRSSSRYSIISLTGMDHNYIPMSLLEYGSLSLHKNEVFDPDKEDGFNKLRALVIQEHTKHSQLPEPDFDDGMIEQYNLHKASGQKFREVEDNISERALAFVRAVKEGKDEELTNRPRLHSYLKSDNAETRQKSFLEILEGRRIFLGLNQLPAEFLGNAKKPKEKSMVLFSLLKNGTIDSAQDDNNRYQAFRALRVGSLKKMDDYSFEKADQLRITQEERTWLRKYGPEIAQK